MKHNKANHEETKTFEPCVATVLVPVFAVLYFKNKLSD